MNAKRPLCAAPASVTPAPAASQSYDYVNLDHSGGAQTALAEEVALAIAYNGISQAVMLVTPTDLEDFIVGLDAGDEKGGSLGHGGWCRCERWAEGER